MPKFIARLEKRLCLAEGLQWSRLDLCLALHAALRGRCNVPRVFLPVGESPDFDRILASCLTCSAELVQSDTNACLQALRLSPLPYSPERVADAIALVEGVLAREWGEGEVHYEMARFTPFTSESIGAVLSRLYKPEALLHLPHASRLWRVICQRDAEATSLTRECLGHCSVHPIPWLMSPYAAALRAKADGLWKKRWHDASAYVALSSGERLVDNLVFSEDL